MRKYQLTFIAVFLLCLAACDTEQQSKEEVQKVEMNEQTPSVDLMESLLTKDKINLKLNGTEKWILSENDLAALTQIKKEVYYLGGRLDGVEIGELNELGLKMLGYLNELSPDGLENSELRKLKELLNVQIEALISSDLKAAQVAIINLNTLFELVPVYFTS